MDVFHIACFSLLLLFWDGCLIGLFASLAWVFHYDHYHGDQLHDRAVWSAIAHIAYKRAHSIVIHEGPPVCESHPKEEPYKECDWKADLVIKGALSRRKDTDAGDCHDVDLDAADNDCEFHICLCAGTDIFLEPCNDQIWALLHHGLEYDIE